MLLPAILNSF